MMMMMMMMNEKNYVVSWRDNGFSLKDKLFFTFKRLISIIFVLKFHRPAFIP